MKTEMGKHLSQFSYSSSVVWIMLIWDKKKKEKKREALKITDMPFVNRVNFITVKGRYLDWDPVSILLPQQVWIALFV